MTYVLTDNVSDPSDALFTLHVHKMQKPFSRSLPLSNYGVWESEAETEGSSKKKLGVFKV